MSCYLSINLVSQNPAYIEYMYANSFIPLAAKEHLEAQWKECLDRAVYNGKVITTQSFARCGILEAVLEASGMPNMYNVDAGDYGPLWATLSSFMNDPQVQTILHARGKNLPGLNFRPEDSNAELDKDGMFHPKQWLQCNDAITIAMRKDHPVSVVPAVAFITQHMKYDLTFARTALYYIYLSIYIYIYLVLFMLTYTDPWCNTL